MKTMGRLAAVATIMILAACGKGLSGTYKAVGPAHFQSLTFESGDKVQLAFMGQTGEGAYKKDGSQVTVTANGQSVVFSIDSQGCVDGGGALGKYCKG